jgi:hypothetical protein
MEKAKVLESSRDLQGRVTITVRFISGGVLQSQRGEMARSSSTASRKNTIAHANRKATTGHDGGSCSGRNAVDASSSVHPPMAARTITVARLAANPRESHHEERRRLA